MDEYSDEEQMLMKLNMPIARLATGISGCDGILGGGLLRGHRHLLAGGPHFLSGRHPLRTSGTSKQVFPHLQKRLDAAG